MNDSDCIVGIDLGTTNSEIAVYIDGDIKIIEVQGSRILPSCVGVSATGELMVGQAARNQQLLYPERTVRSIKRNMGSDKVIKLGDNSFSPQEISAFIIRELVEWAQRKTGYNIKKAVITVPAYFSDAQRNATREAGQITGLEVVRILNEPTAASLAYGYGFEKRCTTMIYDLGGGTFDVSIVTIENDITEVLSSHGNNYLGGDDFDQLFVDHLIKEFYNINNVDISAGYPAAISRLFYAAEKAKKTLSFEPFVKIREEALITIDGVPLHLETEISREKHEDMIMPMIESTLDSVAKAMEDAGKKSGDLDAILLVGGSTRIPLVAKVIEKRTGITPIHDIHPDLCVVMGSGVLAARLSGHEISKVLVDVTPYSFGVSYFGDRSGEPYPYCYHPIIKSNTALPVTRAEKYYTTYPYQTEVAIDIYQGDDSDALKNIPVGNFVIKGLKKTKDHNMVLCRMNLDIDGILQVIAIEKETGKSKQITIQNSIKPKSKEEIFKAQENLQKLYSSRMDEINSIVENADDLFLENDIEDDDSSEDDNSNDEYEKTDDCEKVDEIETNDESDWAIARSEAKKLIERSRNNFKKMHDEDKEEAIELHEEIESAIVSRNIEKLNKVCEVLKELLFFVEGS